jgi:cyanophycinase
MLQRTLVQVFWFLLPFLLVTTRANADVIHYLSGNAEDVRPPLKGPALYLAGGGGDIDEGYQWMIDQARGCTNCETKVDVVVLCAACADSYNDYFQTMKGVDSVESLVITTPDASNTADVERKVKNAEVIFFSGGDQCNYVKNFKGTLVEEAVKSVYDRGGSVGGTSAGLAIQGQYSFDACVEKSDPEPDVMLNSKVALADPYGSRISITRDFFHWKDLENTITDTHFKQRDRIGRLLTFLARLVQDKVSGSMLGIGVDAKTAVALNSSGMGTVMGNGPAWFILADHAPEVCVKGKPLTYKNFKIWRKLKGETFDLRHRPTDGFYLRSVVDGLITEDPY